MTKKNPEPDAFKAVRGLDGWKEAEFDLDGTDIKLLWQADLEIQDAL